MSKQASKLSEAENIFLQKLARKTWSFFEKFVTAEENWLPPDNYQETPVDVIAHRTSPTNIGLSLLANLAAYDFGYINSAEFIERTTGTINTMQKLERYKGHFYNWYDTLSLKPLWPRYISTVDSGNLAGHLLTLRQGILGLSHLKMVSPKLLEGINDTLKVLFETVSHNDTGEKINLALLSVFKAEIEKISQSGLIILEQVKVAWKNYQNKFAPILNNTDSICGKSILQVKQEWKEAFAKQIQRCIDDLKLLAPWLYLPVAPDKFKDLILNIGIPTLQELARIDISMEPEILSLALLIIVRQKKNGWPLSKLLLQKPVNMPMNG